MDLGSLDKLVSDASADHLRRSIRELLQLHGPDVAEIVRTSLKGPSPSPSPPPEPEAPGSKPVVRGYMDGCFDLIHSGHYNALRQAKEICDHLTIGVCSDETVASQKGPTVLTQEERYEMARHIKWVDEVLEDAPWINIESALEKTNSAFVVHGDDIVYSADGTDAYSRVRDKGLLRVIKRTEGVSTTNLVGRMLLATKQHLMHERIPEPIALADGENIDTLPSSSLPGSRRPAGSGVVTSTWRLGLFANNRKPGPDDTIVYVEGTFDLFHVGHLRVLKKAKALGTFLYVGLHDDKTVNSHKGVNYPIMTLYERAMNVLACDVVDDVILGAPWAITDKLIDTLNIHKVVVGTVHDKQFCRAENYAAAIKRNIYYTVDSSSDLTTEQLIQRVIENRAQFEERQRKRVAATGGKHIV